MALKEAEAMRGITPGEDRAEKPSPEQVLCHKEWTSGSHAGAAKLKSHSSPAPAQVLEGGDPGEREREVWPTTRQGSLARCLESGRSKLTDRKRAAP